MWDYMKGRGSEEREARAQGGWVDTHLLLLLVEVVNDDTDEEVESEEGPKDDEDDKIEVHVDVHLVLGLFFLLQRPQDRTGWDSHRDEMEWDGEVEGNVGCSLLPISLLAGRAS